MSRVFEALCAHLKTHPEAEVQDAVKFLYQASFGGGHFLSDPDGAYLVFGREDAGLPEELLAAHEADCVRMPMRRGERCLNLSNAVAVGVYEALRQWDFAGLETHGQLTRYEWSEDVK